MKSDGKATRIELLNFSTPPMRAFHMTWIAFFLCFFAWFGIAPLMAVVRDELQLTKDQVGWCIIGSVAVTILARLLVGWLCDRIGPRLTYTWLLLLGSLPVMAIGLAHDFTTFLIFRVLIGAIGASFVITQYHTSRMFAAELRGHGERDGGRLGQSRRRRDAVGHAAAVRAASSATLGLTDSRELAAGDGRRRRCSAR